MNIEIWSDISCPYCYIGKKQLEQALAELPFKDEVNLQWRSFELEPELTESVSKNKYELLAEKYDQSEEWAKLLCESLTAQGKDLGIDFDFANNQVTNTFKAHTLLQVANEQNKGDQLKQMMFERFFERNQNIADQTVLAEIAAELGIGEADLDKTLSNPMFQQKVKDDEKLAQDIGIQSVPFFIIDEAVGMEGAQPASHIKSMLNDIYHGKLN